MPEGGPQRVRRVRRLRLHTRRPIALPGRTRAAVRCGVGLPQRLHRATRDVLRASRVGRPSSSGPGTIVPGDPGDLFAEPATIFRNAGADRDVLDWGT